MSIYVKIREGTGKLTGTSLCRSCSFALIRETIKGETANCCTSWQPIPIYENIINCSKYNNSALPTLTALEETAWTVKTSSDGRTIGFKSPEKKDK